MVFESSSQPQMTVVKVAMMVEMKLATALPRTVK